MEPTSPALVAFSWPSPVTEFLNMGGGILEGAAANDIKLVRPGLASVTAGEPESDPWCPPLLVPTAALIAAIEDVSVRWVCRIFIHRATIRALRRTPRLVADPLAWPAATGRPRICPPIGAAAASNSARAATIQIATFCTSASQ